MINSSLWISEQLRRERPVWAILDMTQVPDVLENYPHIDTRPLVPWSRISNIDKICMCVQLTEQHFDWYQDYKANSILVAGDNCIEHFGSLFEAHIEGESVLFPFYCPDYIAPMMDKFTESELQTFLGGNYLWVQGRQYEPDGLSVISKKNMWWEIKPHHLAEQVSKESLRNWMWQHHSDRMIFMTENGYDFDDILDNHLELSLNKTMGAIRAILQILRKQESDLTLNNLLESKSVFEILDGYK